MAQDKFQAKAILVRGVGVVTYLMTAFGGFFTRIAPPDTTGAAYSVGIVSMLLLAVLLGVSAFGSDDKDARRRGRWIRVGIAALVLALPLAFVYHDLLDRFSYGFPPEAPAERHLNAGSEALLPKAQEWTRQHPTQASPAELELNLPVGAIWNAGALASASRALEISYVCLVVVLATAIFCLVEANVPVGRRRSPRIAAPRSAESKAAGSSAGSDGKKPSGRRRQGGD